jgi:hypothetical protein
MIIATDLYAAHARRKKRTPSGRWSKKIHHGRKKLRPWASSSSLKKIPALSFLPGLR